MLRAILICVSTALLPACATPPQAVKLSDLIVKQTEIMKRDVEAYASSVNAARSAAAARLSEMTAQTALRARRTEARQLSWELSGNKIATDLMTQIRSLETAKPTDVYAIAGIQSEVEAQMKARFGTVRADTSALTEVITKAKASVKPDAAAQLRFTLKLVQTFAESSGLAKGRVKELLDAAEATAGEAADELEADSRPTDNTGASGTGS